MISRCTVLSYKVTLVEFANKNPIIHAHQTTESSPHEHLTKLNPLSVP